MDINNHNVSTSIFAHAQNPDELAVDSSCLIAAPHLKRQSNVMQSVTAERLQLSRWFILLESVLVWLGARLLIA